MNPHLRALLVLVVAWLPVAARAQSPVGDPASDANVEIKAENLAFIAGFNTLYRLDLSTGAASVVGSGFGTAAGVAVADVDSMAFAPDGSLYAVADSPQALLRISTASGRATLVGQFRESGQLLDPSANLNAALTFTCSGKLLMSSRTQRRLYEVDVATASVRSVGALPVTMGGLAARGAELLGLGVEGNQGLYRIDESTASATQIPNALAGRNYLGGAIAFASDGRLFAVFDNYPQAGPVLAELTPTTGAVRRELSITGPQLGNGAADRPVRALAIAAPVCAPINVGGSATVAVPALGASGLALMGLVLALFAVLVLRRDTA